MPSSKLPSYLHIRKIEMETTKIFDGIIPCYKINIGQNKKK